MVYTTNVGVGVGVGGGAEYGTFLLEYIFREFHHTYAL